ncbi:MAG TPA: hypothetical protein VGN26_01895 [Armatimonadota bacterium]
MTARWRRRILVACLAAAVVALLPGCAGGISSSQKASLTVLTGYAKGTVLTLAEEKLPQELTPLKNSAVDDQGAARFYDLTPGEYVVAYYLNGQIVNRTPHFGLGPGPNQVQLR